MNPFTSKAITIINSIPVGSVVTCGRIARLTGSPRGARQVVRILHSMSGKYGLPWHRVVNAKGQIVIKDEESNYSQKFLLQIEGVIVTETNRVDLAQYQHHPDDFLE